MGVVLDVVYNHFGPSDLIYGNSMAGARTGKEESTFITTGVTKLLWGATRPDYGRKEVRQFIFDNAMMWLRRIPRRWPSIRYVTVHASVRGNADPGADLPDGWSLIQWINQEVRKRHPGRITIAEDLRNY